MAHGRQSQIDTVSMLPLLDSKLTLAAWQVSMGVCVCFHEVIVDCVLSIGGDL